MMALIVVTGVMSGLQSEIRDRILGTNPHVMLLAYGEGLRLENWQGVLDTVRTDEAVSLAEPFVYSDALVFQDVNYQQGVVLRGVTEDGARRLSEQVIAGDFDHDGSGDLPGIVLGFRLADRLLVGLGDTINLVSGHGAELTAAGFIPKFERVRVTGLFKSGMYEYDSTMGYVPLRAAQDLLGLGNAVTGLALWVDQPWEADAIAERLRAELNYQYALRDWKRMNEGLFSALKLEKMGMALILFLIVLVAAFNIVSTLIMVVTDKTREIGILRSMGMTARRILRVFMLQGLTIGVAGTVLGVIGGIGVAWAIDEFGLISLPGDVYLIDRLPVVLNPVDLIVIVLVSTFITFVATIYPSRQAAGLPPVEAIRRE